MATQLERKGKQTQRQLQKLLPAPVFKKLIQPKAGVKMAPRGRVGSMG